MRLAPHMRSVINSLEHLGIEPPVPMPLSELDPDFVRTVNEQGETHHGRMAYLQAGELYTGLPKEMLWQVAGDILHPVQDVEPDTPAALFSQRAKFYPPQTVLSQIAEIEIGFDNYPVRERPTLGLSMLVSKLPGDLEEGEYKMEQFRFGLTSKMRADRLSNIISFSGFYDPAGTLVRVASKDLAFWKSPNAPGLEGQAPVEEQGTPEQQLAVRVMEWTDILEGFFTHLAASV